MIQMRHVKKTKLSESNEFESDKQMDDYSPSLSSPSPTIPPTNAYNVESSTVENGNCSESIDSVLDKVTNGKRVILADDSVGPKPVIRGGVNGSRSKFLPIKISSKFESSAYIPKSHNPSSILTKVWSSY